MKFSHEWIEKNPWLLIGLVLLVVSIGVVIASAIPSRSIAALRLAESSAPANLIPSWVRATSTFEAVVQ